MKTEHASKKTPKTKEKESLPKPLFIFAVKEKE